MARRSPYSRPLVYTLGALLAVAAVVGVYKLLAGPSVSVASAPEAKPADPAPVASPAPQKPADPAPVRTSLPLAANPTTRPAATPAHAPVIRDPAPVTPLTPVTPVVAPAPSTSDASATQLIADADAKRKADDLIAARKLLVDAIDTHKLSAADHDDVLRRLNEINETVVFSNRKFISDPYAVAHVVKPGESMEKIAKQYDVTWKFIGRLNNISDPRKLQAGKSLKIVKGPFHALVDKSDFTLDIYLGKPGEPGAILVKRLRVGLGESDSTPTGVWNIDNKLENPRYYNPRAEGPRVIEPDDPKNPLGERWIALVGASGQAVGKTSYGIHGTIDPESIGQKKSMGCIRMLNEDVELVYDMLVTGKSTVTVVD